MFRILAGHRVCVTELHAFQDARFDEWFSDLELVIGLDGRALEEIVGVFPALATPHAVSLADAVPWCELVGRPLVPFDGFVRAHALNPLRAKPSPVPTPLRLCALMGAALVLNEGAPLRHLLESVKDYFASPPNQEGATP